MPSYPGLPLSRPRDPGADREKLATWGPGRVWGTRDHMPLEASTSVMLQTLSYYLCGLRGGRPGTVNTF